MNLIVIVSVTVLCTLTSSLSALQCYSCQGKGNDICVVNPTSARTKACNYNEQCYITRSENTGGYVSIERGCKSYVSITSSSSWGGSSSWSQSCSTDLCNSGDGTSMSFPMPNFNPFNGFNGFDGFNGFNGDNRFPYPVASPNAAPKERTNKALMTALIAAVAVVLSCVLPS